MTFPEWLRDRMHERAIKPRELAHRLHRSKVAIYAWLGGQSLPPSTIRDALAAALGVSREDVERALPASRRIA